MFVPGYSGGSTTDSHRLPDNRISTDKNDMSGDEKAQGENSRRTHHKEFHTRYAQAAKDAKE